MVQAFAPHAADQAFHIRILPRAPWRRNDLFHAHRRHGRAERLPVCAVPVADQVPRRRAPRECLSDLLCDPRHRRVRRYTEMHDLAALVVEHDEPEQEVERGRGDHEEIDRRQAIGVICKECPPRLRWRRWVTDHVFRDGGLGDGKAKLQKLAMPYYIPELRGHSLSVAATDPRTGVIADYSNRCGSLPSDWNAARHGRHYCLAAPGTVRGLIPNPNTPGQGDVRGGLQGTSYAAPIVSGALALLKEHFRGRRGNAAIVKRMIDTANRSGHYADLETYGAGHLDIAAALSPVGSLNAGQSAQALSRTTLRTPAAFGSVAGRAASIELAAFDEQDFPFWVPLSGLISARSDRRSPIPEFLNAERNVTPATGLGALRLHWAMPGDAGGLPFLDDREWVMGLGPSSASLARLPHDGGWGYGFSFDNAGYLGSQTSGAFGSDLRSGMIWTSRAFERELGEGWTLNAKGALAVSLPQYEHDAIFSASPSVMSAMSMRIGTGSTGLTVEQPFRAESGTGTFRVENGRIENGRRLHNEYRIPLRPDARELRIALRHEREALGGDIAVKAGHSVNAGHVPGESETSVGLAYRITW